MIEAGEGADIVEGGDGIDTIHGGAGNDRLGGGGGVDTIYGEVGEDTIYGDSSYDVTGTVVATDTGLHAGDFLYGGTEADRITAKGATTTSTVARRMT